LFAALTSVIEVAGPRRARQKKIWTRDTIPISKPSNFKHTATGKDGLVEAKAREEEKSVPKKPEKKEPTDPNVVRRYWKAFLTGKSPNDF